MSSTTKQDQAAVDKEPRRAVGRIGKYECWEVWKKHYGLDTELSVHIQRKGGHMDECTLARLLCVLQNA